MYRFLLKTEDLLEGFEKTFISLAIIMFFITTLLSFVYLYYGKMKQVAMVTMDVFSLSIIGLIFSIFIQKLVSNALEKYKSNANKYEK